MQTEYRLGRLKDRFVVTWWVGGKRKRYRLEATDKKAAAAEAIDVVRGKTVAKSEPTIADLWQAYRDAKDGRRVAVAMKHEWKAVGPHFGHLRADQVDKKLCDEYAATRRKLKKKNGTIWTELGHLRSVFKWALGEKLISHAPAVERPSKPAPKDRWLTHAEIDRLLSAKMEHHIKLAILLMLATAGRVGAILELKWERVDFERGQVDLRQSDIGPRKGRAVVPMNAGLRAALLQAKEGAMTEHVVEWAGEPVQSIRTGFRAACQAAKLEGVTPHVLRHTAAVHLAAGGIAMDRIAQYLGHSDPRITFKVYARFAPEHMKEESEILDFTKVRKVQ